MVRRLVGILFGFSLLVLGMTASVAHAAGSQATDPNAASPAGVVYSIPLDSARQDAAPHGGHNGHSGAGTGITGGGGSGGSGGGAGGTGGTGGSGGGTGGSGTTGGSASSGDSGSSSPVLVPGGQPGSLVHSSNGFGSSSQVPGLGHSSSAGLGAVQNNASSAPVLAFLLAGVVLLLGGYVGVRAWRTARPHTP